MCLSESCGVWDMGLFHLEVWEDWVWEDWMAEGTVNGTGSFNLEIAHNNQPQDGNDQKLLPLDRCLVPLRSESGLERPGGISVQFIVDVRSHHTNDHDDWC